MFRSFLLWWARASAPATAAVGRFHPQDKYEVWVPQGELLGSVISNLRSIWYGLLVLDSWMWIIIYKGCNMHTGREINGSCPVDVRSGQFFFFFFCLAGMFCSSMFTATGRSYAVNISVCSLNRWSIYVQKSRSMATSNKFWYTMTWYFVPELIHFCLHISPVSHGCVHLCYVQMEGPCIDKSVCSASS